LLGFRSRCTTPAEWTYFNPRYSRLDTSYARRQHVGKELLYQNLVKKVLDELLFQGSRGQKAMEVGPEKLRYEVARPS